MTVWGEIVLIIKTRHDSTRSWKRWTWLFSYPKAFPLLLGEDKHWWYHMRWCAFLSKAGVPGIRVEFNCLLFPLCIQISMSSLGEKKNYVNSQWYNSIISNSSQALRLSLISPLLLSRAVYFRPSLVTTIPALSALCLASFASSSSPFCPLEDEYFSIFSCHKQPHSLPSTAISLLTTNQPLPMQSLTDPLPQIADRHIQHHNVWMFLPDVSPPGLPQSKFF